jgi:small GTP-binding protein
MDYYEKVVTSNNQKYLIKFWDTAGQEKYRTLTRSYYKKAHGIIVACSLEDRNSFHNLTNWLNSIKDNTKEDIQLIIIGNKSDLNDTRQVKSYELDELARKRDIHCFETSAKDNSNITEAIEVLVNSVIEKGINKAPSFSIFNIVGGPRKDSNSGKKTCESC